MSKETNWIKVDEQQLEEVKQFQVIVYGEDDEIVSSQQFDEEPTDEMLDELLKEGVKIECYEVEGDEYSKLLFTYD